MLSERAESQRPEGGLRRNANGGGKNGLRAMAGGGRGGEKEDLQNPVVEVLELPC